MLNTYLAEMQLAITVSNCRIQCINPASRGMNENRFGFTKRDLAMLVGDTIGLPELSRAESKSQMGSVAKLDIDNIPYNQIESPRQFLMTGRIKVMAAFEAMLVLDPIRGHMQNRSI